MHPGRGGRALVADSEFLQVPTAPVGALERGWGVTSGSGCHPVTAISVVDILNYSWLIVRIHLLSLANLSKERNAVLPWQHVDIIRRLAAPYCEDGRLPSGLLFTCGWSSPSDLLIHFISFFFNPTAFLP